MDDIKLTIKSYINWVTDHNYGEILDEGGYYDVDPYDVVVGEDAINALYKNIVSEIMVAGLHPAPMEVTISWQGKDVDCDLGRYDYTCDDFKKMWEYGGNYER